MESNQSHGPLNDKCSLLMGALGASVSKHILDGHFTCVWANDYFYDLIGYPKGEFEARFHCCPDEYFFNNPEGWTQLVESVRGALDAGEPGSARYLRLLSPKGEPFWVKLRAVFLDEYAGGYQMAYAIMTDVTDLMEAQLLREETRRAAERIAGEQDMLMSALRVSVSKHLVDEHFTCIRANEYYYQLIGYPKERYEALFHNHPDEYYANNPEGWAMLTEKVVTTLEQGQDKYEAIIPMKYEDGSTFWVKLYNYFTDEYIDGYRCSYTVMTDVTELVQMRNEQELLMRSMKVSVSRHMVDEHFTLVWANNFYYQLIGYSKPEYEALFHGQCDAYFQNNLESWNKINKKVQEMRERGDESYEVFLPLKLPDGSTRWVKMMGFFTSEYQDGKRLAYTTMVDVTDLMLVRQEKTIAYDNIPGFIVKYRILKDRIIMTEASDRITEVFRVDPGNLEAFDPYAILQKESRIMIEANHPNFRRGEPFEGTIGAVDKDGRDRWFQIHCTCIDAISDDPAYLTVFIDVTDVTELRELQKKLEQRTELLNIALEEAKQANAAKSDFLSRMSHDIRTPMNAIAGMTEIADAHLEEPTRVRDCLQKIRLSSRHLLGLVNDVLDMSKIESGNFPLHIAAFSLREALREVVMITMVSARERRQSLDVRLVRVKQELFYCDALRLRQILLNLLSNAVKFTPEEGRITLTLEQLPPERPEQALLRFTVSDTGPGMKPEFLEHLFEAFTREQDSRTDRIEGSGLGMAIAKRLTDLLGGSITVESTPGEGTTFQVTLPMRPVPQQPEDNFMPDIRVLLTGSDTDSLNCDLLGTARLEQESAPLNFIGKKFLLAEDNEINREIALELIGSFGAVLETAADGQEAVRKFEESPPFSYDLILMDIQMPVMNGYEATRTIRALNRKDAQTVPIIAMTADAFVEDIQNAEAAGMNGHMSKPLDFGALAGELSQYLGGVVR